MCSDELRRRIKSEWFFPSSVLVARMFGVQEYRKNVHYMALIRSNLAPGLLLDFGLIS